MKRREHHHHSNNGYHRERARAGVVAIWALLPGVPAIAVFTSLVVGVGPYASLWAMVMLGSGTLAVYGVHQVTKSRADLVTWSTGTTAGAYAWLMLATFLPNPGTGRPIGPLSWLLILWLMLATPLCLVLTVRILPSVREAASGDSPATGALGAVAEALRGAKISDVKTVDGTVSAQVELPPGEDFQDVQRAHRGIASTLGVPATQVRLTPLAGAAPNHGTIAATTGAGINAIRPWAPLSAPGGPVSTLIAIGAYEDNKPAGIYLVGDPKKGINAAGIIVVMGMKGAGKTELMIRVLAEFLSRLKTERELWLGDPRKFGQLPRFARELATRTAKNQQECAVMLNDLMKLVAWRAKWLGDRGFEQWEDECGIPFLLVWIDEAAGLDEESDRLVDVGETVRSVGICVVTGYQRVTGDRMPSSFKAQVSTVICLGVRDIAEARRVLSEETLDAGADPSVWKDRLPGAAYLEGSGIDPERFPIPLRVYHGTRQEVILSLADAGVEGVAQFLADEPRRGSKRTREREQEVETMEDRDESQAEPVETDEEENESMDSEQRYRRGEDEVDPREPIAIPEPPPEIKFGAPQVAMAPGEAARVIREYAVRLAEQAREEGDDALIAPADFHEALAAVGRGASWLSGQLAELSKPGPGQVLVRLAAKGRYVPAGMPDGPDDGDDRE